MRVVVRLVLIDRAVLFRANMAIHPDKLARKSRY